MTNLTLQLQQPETNQEEIVFIFGNGFRMIINGQGKPEFFNDKHELVTDVNERMTMQEKLVLPLIKKLSASWKQEWADAYQLGDRMPDTSYYMGISEDTFTHFFLFIDNIGENEYADVVSIEKGENILREKCNNKEKFHGHNFSEFHEEKEIIQSYRKNTADGGLRRLTRKELEQV